MGGHAHRCQGERNLPTELTESNDIRFPNVLEGQHCTAIHGGPKLSFNTKRNEVLKNKGREPQGADILVVDLCSERRPGQQAAPQRLEGLCGRPALDDERHVAGEAGLRGVPGANIAALVPRRAQAPRLAVSALIPNRTNAPLLAVLALGGGIVPLQPAVDPAEVALEHGLAAAIAKARPLEERCHVSHPDRWAWQGTSGRRHVRLVHRLRAPAVLLSMRASQHRPVRRTNCGERSYAPTQEAGWKDLA
mmetsp:Transcript_43024/g.121641  ORF Transcript_43024/g.121641 Transcript_43024/m.121641 type:complete len:249 (+) Transcript_43024:593-1339(+)